MNCKHVTLIYLEGLGEPKAPDPSLLSEVIMKCNIEDCNKERGNTAGLCHAHYCRWQTHGDPYCGGPIRQRNTGYCNRGHKRDDTTVDRWRTCKPCASIRKRARKYDLPETNVEMLLALGTCAICDADCSQDPIFDHDHETGLFRGLICRRCNVTLGYVNDDIDLLLELAQYLGQRRNHVS